MLTLLLVLASLPNFPPRTIPSVAALDAVCAEPDYDGPVSLDLERGTFALVADSSGEPEPFAAAPRPLRALGGRVRIHLVDRVPLSWVGEVDETTARVLVENSEARATMIGRLAHDPGFPTCFGHKMSSYRSVAMKLDALYLYGASGRALGRYAPVDPDRQRGRSTGLRTEIDARCGVPCVLDDAELEASLAEVRSALMACTTGSPEGTAAFELVTDEGFSAPVRVRGEVSTLPVPVVVCARTVLEKLRPPPRNQQGVILLEIDVAGRGGRDT